MNSFNRFLRWALSILVVCTMAFALGACSGDDGKDGAAGRDGVDGTDGAPAPVPDAVTAAIEKAQVESCSTCHDDVGGGGHQVIYDSYVDASAFEMTFTDFTSTPSGALFDVSLEVTITKNGAPFTDYAGLDQKRFYTDRFDSTTGEYFEAFTSLNDTVTMVTDGNYVITEAGLSFNPTVNGQIYGYIAQTPLFEKFGGSSEIPSGSHVHLYDDVASAALAYGDAMATDPDAYVSAANVEGCIACHGAPYAKHGYREAVVAGIPDFASCKVCHNDDGEGGHIEWQYMVDEPLNWATGVAATADYSYFRNIMNDTHMSHAMEFPYPMSMSNCNTCHEDKLDMVLNDESFTAETCMSCHPLQGINAWPEDVGATLEGDYAQAHRAPALEFLWARAGVDQAFHTATANCISCHSDPLNPPGTGFASTFDQYHNGFDAAIYDATGTRYADMYSVSIDDVSMAGDLMTVTFSSNDPLVIPVPELLVSFYGWDSKNFIVGSHERDANAAACPGGHGDGCKMEYVPESSGGSANPLFVEDALSVPGAWIVTLDVSALQTYKTDDIPTLIADGVIHKAEVSITPELELGGMDVVLTAVNQTYDLNISAMIDDYFKGANAAVDIDKCNACHDTLASSFHAESGRGGDGIEVCKHCHTTTFPGSHLEMASRAIDSYVHAIHTFQPFDLGSVDATDAVEVARTELHMGHGFPTFSITGCEACHVAGTFNVPDQSKSMPGLLSASDDIPDRNIGTVPEAVTGPASRACGGCHRADMINEDHAGELASFDAHTGTFGTYAENDADDAVVFGIVDKIMSWFE